MSPILSHSSEEDRLAHQEVMGLWQLIFEFHCITTIQLASFKHQEAEQEAAPGPFWAGRSLDPSSMKCSPGFLFSQHSCPSLCRSLLGWAVSCRKASRKDPPMCWTVTFVLGVSGRSAKPNRASICALLLTSNSFLTSLAPPKKEDVNWGWAICGDKSLSLHKNPLTDQKCKRRGKFTFQCLFGNSLHQKHSAVTLHTLQMQVCFAKKGLINHTEKTILPFPQGIGKDLDPPHQRLFFQSLCCFPTKTVTQT